MVHFSRATAAEERTRHSIDCADKDWNGAICYEAGKVVYIRRLLGWTWNPQYLHSRDRLTRVTRSIQHVGGQERKVRWREGYHRFGADRRSIGSRLLGSSSRCKTLKVSILTRDSVEAVKRTFGPRRQAMWQRSKSECPIALAFLYRGSLTVTCISPAMISSTQKSMPRTLRSRTFDGQVILDEALFAADTDYMPDLDERAQNPRARSQLSRRSHR